MSPNTFELLAYRGSLTQRFKEMMGQTPKLTVLKQRREIIPIQDRISLPIGSREWAFVREIKMSKGNQDWMYARTIVPTATLKGNGGRLTGLGNTSIGKILFGRNGAYRQDLKIEEVIQLPIVKGLKMQLINYPLWQRRSIFELQSGPILVTELFLPDCPIYSSSNL